MSFRCGDFNAEDNVNNEQGLPKQTPNQLVFTMAGHLVMSPTEEGRSAGVCVVCTKKQANAELRHNQFGTMRARKDSHRCCCFECAIFLKSKNYPCLVCGRPIRSIFVG